MKETTTLLELNEVTRKTCFEELEYGETFNVTVTSSDGVFLKEFLVSDVPISINGNVSFWMDDYDDTMIKVNKDSVYITGVPYLQSGAGLPDLYLLGKLVTTKTTFVTL